MSTSETQYSLIDLSTIVNQIATDCIEESGDRRKLGLHEKILSHVERGIWQAVMKRTADNQSLSAAILGISRGTFRKVMKELKNS